MYKNQLQELAQRSCFNLPSYSCVREGPDHAPRFRATVNFNGEIFESPHYCSTLRQAEHSAAEVALSSLSSRHSLAARILDETGVYKNLLQEIAQRVAAPLPQYTTFRSGLGHQPVFTGIVELAGIAFTGEPAKNKKQAEKNAAMSAWSSLKQLAKEYAGSSPESENADELEQITIARALMNYRTKEKLTNNTFPSTPFPFTKKFSSQALRPTSPQHHPATSSRILPLILPKTTPRGNPPRPVSPLPVRPAERPLFSSYQNFPGAGAAPYIPLRQYASCKGMAPPVTIRTAVPVFSAPPVAIRSAAPRNPSCPPPVTVRQVSPDASAILNLPNDLLSSPVEPSPAIKLEELALEPSKLAACPNRGVEGPDTSNISHETVPSLKELESTKDVKVKLTSVKI